MSTLISSGSVVMRQYWLCALWTVAMLANIAAGWLSCKGRPSGLFDASAGVQVYCNGNDAVLLQKAQPASQCPTYDVVNGLGPTACGFVAESTARNLAQLSTTVILSDAGTVEMSTTSCAVESLRVSTTWQYSACSWSGNWVWTWNPENAQCANVLAGESWPVMFHGCGQASAVHWVSNVAHHSKDNPSASHTSTDSSTYLFMSDACTDGSVGAPLTGCRVCESAADCNSHAFAATDDGFRDTCVCSCDEGWAGMTCGTRGACTVPLDCDSRYSTAVTGTYPSCACVCVPRYSNPRCSVPDACSNDLDCSGHASQVAGTYPSCSCTCEPGYVGTACEVRICHKAVDCIGNRTRFVTGEYPFCECHCVLGFGGATCMRTLTTSYSYSASPTAVETPSDSFSATSAATSSVTSMSAGTLTHTQVLTMSATLASTASLTYSTSTTMSATHTPSLSLSDTTSVSKSWTLTSSFGSPSCTENRAASTSISSATLSMSACLGVAAPVAAIPLGGIMNLALPSGVRPRTSDCDFPTTALGSGTFYLLRRTSRNGRPLCLMLGNVPLSWHLHLKYPRVLNSDVLLKTDLVLVNATAPTAFGNISLTEAVIFHIPLDVPIIPFMLSKVSALTGNSDRQDSLGAETSSDNSPTSSSSESDDNSLRVAMRTRWIPLGSQNFRTTIFVACAAIHTPLELVLQYEPSDIAALDTVSTAMAVVTVFLGGSPAMGSSIPLLSALTCDDGETVAPVSQFTMLMVSFFYDVSTIAVVFGNVAFGLVVLGVGLVVVLAHWACAAVEKSTDTPQSLCKDESVDDENDFDRLRGARLSTEARLLESAGACRFPSWPMRAVEFLTPGVAFGAVLLLVSPTTAPGEYVAAAIGVMISAVYPFVYYILYSRWILPKAVWHPWPALDDANHPAYSQHLFVKRAFPLHQWRSRELRLAFNPFMGSMKPSTAALWRPVEVAIAFAPAVGAGVSAGGAAVLPYACVSVGYVIVAMYLTVAVLVAYKRPYRLPVDVVLCPALFAVVGVSLLIKMTSALLARRVNGNERVEAALALGAACLQVLQVTLQLLRTVAALYITWLEGRVPDMIMTPLSDVEMTEDCDILQQASADEVVDRSIASLILATETSQEELQGGGAIPPEEFDKLFLLLDGAEASDEVPSPVFCPLPTDISEDSREEPGTFFGIVGYFSKIKKAIAERTL